MRGKSVQMTKPIAFARSFQLAREKKLIYKHTVDISLGVHDIEMSWK